MIRNFNKQQLEKVLNQFLTPSDPVKDARHLYGRVSNLREISTALSARGRQVFIHGERGVGKTSLAWTAACQHLPDREAPIYVPCGGDTKFYGFVRHLAGKLMGNPFGNTKTVTESVGGGGEAAIMGFGFNADASKQTSREDGAIPQVSDLAEAVELIRHAAEKSGKGKHIVIVDEFDVIADLAERGRFADFVKQLGDQSVPIQVIFCGIGSSVADLFEAHNSSVRYLHAIKVLRLDYDYRWEIIDNAAKAIGVRVPEPLRTRIAIISDGFPHYVHLVCFQLFWQMFYDAEERDVASAEHYREAVAEAVRAGDVRYQPDYDKAIQRQSNDYELVLWAAAAHYELVRKSTDIYTFYKDVLLKLIQTDKELDAKQFSTHLRNLKSPRYGAVLRSHKPGWFQFQESMMRGYVRLRAEAQGIELPHDHTPEPNPRLPTVGAPKLRPVRIHGGRRRWG